MVQLALYNPDQAGNCGTLLRLSACLETSLHIIHPCGFSFSSKALKRSGMDYIEYMTVYEHDDYHAFMQKTVGQRKILLTTKAHLSYIHFEFQKDDILLLGRESAGVPDNVHETVDARIIIPLSPQTRSINMAISASMVLGEALRQTDTFPFLPKVSL